MGCSQSANANITPTGDGITALVWSPDWTADTLISRGPQFKGSRESKMWKNQVAIFDKLLGYNALSRDTGVDVAVVGSA